MPKTKKKSFTKLDTTLYLFAFISLLCIFLVKIFGGAEVSHLNMSIEKVKYSINEQTKKNESLTMKVNELVSLENMQSVAQEEGLEYNNNNVVVIQK